LRKELKSTVAFLPKRGYNGRRKALKKKNMSFPAFAWSVRFFSLASTLGLVVLILGVNPEEKSWAPVIFFVSLFLVVFGNVAWGFLALYRRHVGEAGVLQCRRRLLEQAGLFGGLCTTLLFLEYARAFVWWTAGLVFVLFLFVELSLRQTLRKKQHIS
jgi:hypothetical protein